jgi:hypothetical protein
MYGEVEWPVRQQPVKFAGTCCKQFQFQFQLPPLQYHSPHHLPSLGKYGFNLLPHERCARLDLAGHCLH